MPSLNQFNKLDSIEKDKLSIRICERTANYIEEKYNFNSTVLIVGDKPAPSTKMENRVNCVPFASVAHSSLYLNLALDKANILESDLAWVNARDYDDKETESRLLSHEWLKIIALGGIAEAWVNKHGKSCLKIPHPSYWKRFHSKEPYPLIQVLKDLV